MISGVPVLIQVITLVLHFGWCELFIIHFGMREVGAALATNITYILNMMFGIQKVYSFQLISIKHGCASLKSVAY